MRKNIGDVLGAVLLGKPKFGGVAKRSCWTDGAVVYSYAMPIARVVRRPSVKRKGIVEIVERGRAPSNTTRSHIDAVRNLFTFPNDLNSYQVRFVQTI